MMEQWWGKAEEEAERGDQEVERERMRLEGWTAEWEEEIVWMTVMDQRVVQMAELEVIEEGETEEGETEDEETEEGEAEEMEKDGQTEVSGGEEWKTQVKEWPSWSS